MEVALVKAGALDALVGNAALSPAAVQPPEILKTLHEGLKASKEGTENLNRLHQISEAVRARMQAYRTQTILQIELVEQLSAVMSYALTQGSNSDPAASPHDCDYPQRCQHTALRRSADGYRSLARDGSCTAPYCNRRAFGGDPRRITSRKSDPVF